MWLVLRLYLSIVQNRVNLIMLLAKKMFLIPVSCYECYMPVFYTYRRSALYFSQEKTRNREERRPSHRRVAVLLALPRFPVLVQSSRAMSSGPRLLAPPAVAILRSPDA